MHHILLLMTVFVRNSGHARELALKLLPLLTIEHLRELARLIEMLLAANPAAAAEVVVVEAGIESVTTHLIEIEELVETAETVPLG